VRGIAGINTGICNFPVNDTVNGTINEIEIVFEAPISPKEQKTEARLLLAARSATMEFPFAVEYKLIVLSLA